MSVEGIFERNEDTRRLIDLTEAINGNYASVDLTQNDPVQLAALLWRFLRDLPDPLMTFKLYKLFVASQSALTLCETLFFCQPWYPTGAQQEAERLRFLHLVLLILPKAHRDTVEVLFVFLKWAASFTNASTETGKLGSDNLARALCPIILYAKDRIADSSSAVRLVTILLTQQPELFQVPAEFLPFLDDQEYFSNCLEQPSKVVLRKCDAYIRLKYDGRAPAITTRLNSGYSVNALDDTRVRELTGRDTLEQALNHEAPIATSTPLVEISSPVSPSM
jgi:hypothetical protein